MSDEVGQLGECRADVNEKEEQKKKRNPQSDSSDSCHRVGQDSATLPKRAAMSTLTPMKHADELLASTLRVAVKGV